VSPLRWWRRRRTPTVVCRDWVELVTDYLEGTLDASLVSAAEAHLAECDPCRDYLEQMRLTVEGLRGVPAESLSGTARADLLVAFRTWSAERGGA
jgi:anti-sigma factor RsiW